MKYLITITNMPGLDWITLNQCKFTAHWSPIYPHDFCPSPSGKTVLRTSTSSPPGCLHPTEGEQICKALRLIMPTSAQIAQPYNLRKSEKEGHKLEGTAVKPWQKQRWMTEDHRCHFHGGQGRSGHVFQSTVLKSTCTSENSRKLVTQIAGAQKPK